MARSIRTWISLAGALIALAGGVSAETLTICLDEPRLDPPPASAPEESIKIADRKPIPEVVTVKVGRVGMVKVSSAAIYKSKSSKAAKYSTVGIDTPLVIVRDEDGWYGVLMANGAVGWVPSKNVTLTGYEMVSRKSDVDYLADKTGLKQSGKTGTWADQLIRAALNYTGIRYVYGGNQPSQGMDCSAFVRMVFGQFSIPLPRTAREQAQVGTTVPVDQLQPGDRLYFQCKNPYIDHCGIYAGNGYFVHCSSSRNGVSVDSLASNFYGRSLVVAKRS